jgi:hypothetical protein
VGPEPPGSATTFVVANVPALHENRVVDAAAYGSTFGRCSMRVRLAKLMLMSCVMIGAAGAIATQQTAWAAGNLNGVAGSMPAYYDHQLFTINFFQLTTAQAKLLAKNSQQNVIYQSDPGLPGGQPFISVIDAVPADGMNPLWAEVQIAFTAGHTPRQLFSDDEIAAAVTSGEITLSATNEMYRCSVIRGAAPSTASSGATSSFGTSRLSSSAATASNATRTPSAMAAPSTLVASWGAIKTKYR